MGRRIVSLKNRTFHSDFRFVAEYFVASRMRKEGKEPKFSVTLGHLRHVEEFVELMNAITNSRKKCQATPMAMSGIDSLLFGYLVKRGAAQWWLRTPGYETMKSATAAYVEDDGEINTFGDVVLVDHNGVRPAMWVAMG